MIFLIGIFKCILMSCMDFLECLDIFLCSVNEVCQFTLNGNSQIEYI